MPLGGGLFFMKRITTSSHGILFLFEENSSYLSIEPQKKKLSDFPLQWSFNTDLYNCLLYWPFNCVVESPIYPKQLGNFCHCSIEPQKYRHEKLMASHFTGLVPYEMLRSNGL